MFGKRAIYHDGWIAVTPPPALPGLLGTAKRPDVVNGYKWELYNLNDDYSDYNDLSAKNPEKLRDLQELFLLEATKYNVFPLDNSILPRLVTPRTSATAGRTLFTYTGQLAGVPVSDAPSILNKSYAITADVEVPEGGGEGMLATLGGRFGGYGLYVLKGKPVFTYNLVDLEWFRWEGQQALAPGKHTIVFDFKYDGPVFGKGAAAYSRSTARKWPPRLSPHTIPFLMSIDETFGVGIDTRTPVDDNDDQVPFAFKYDQQTYDKPEASIDERRATEAMGRRN
jgi:hypothetical protein